MSAKRLLYAVLVIILAAGIATAVAGGSSKIRVSGLGTSGSAAGQPYVADTSTPTPAPGAAGIVVDPAKQQPVLDQFVSKDPFQPLPAESPPPSPLPTPTETPTPTPTPTPTATPTSSPTSTSTPTPTPTPTATSTNPTSAAVVVGGESSTVKLGGEVPTASPVFTISALTGAGVTFKLLNGATFADGSTSVLVAAGQHVSVTTGGTSYTLKVTKLNYGSGTSGQPNGHVIVLLSINTRNGVSSATFKVDGTTFADKQVGALFTTDWGQVKVLAVNASAQTVTFMHGDATFTIHVGEQIEK